MNEKQLLELYRQSSDQKLAVELNYTAIYNSKHPGGVPEPPLEGDGSPIPTTNPESTAGYQ